MADFINNVAAADQYTAALTVGPDFVAKNAVITVANNPVLMQFAIGKLGSWRWTDEREFFAIPQSFRVGNVIGVKFRNANAGQLARVLATLSGDDDPDFQSGIPFTGVLTASGSVSSVSTINGLTGSVSGAGAVLAGTGFTVVRTAAGRYTVTFTTPLATVPIVVATVNQALSANEIINASGPSVNGFTCLINDGGPGADRQWSFIAIEPQ